MSCRALKRWVWRQGAGELPAPMRDHVTHCPRCRDLLESVQRLDQTVIETADDDPGQRYWELLPVCVQQQLSPPPQVAVRIAPMRSSWRWAWRWAPAVGVAILALLIGNEVIRERTAPLVTERDVPVVRESGAPVTVSAAPGTETAPRSAAVADATRVPGTAHSDKARGGPQVGVSAERAGVETTSRSMSGAAVVRGPGAEMTATAPDAGLGTEAGDAAGTPSSVSTDDGRVWPERQITIMGRITTDTPRQLVADEHGLAGQDAFAAYERQTAQGEARNETAGVFPAPGPLLEAPHHPAPAGFTDSQSPAEAMRRFDEIVELRRLIGRIQDVAPGDRTASDQAQLPALWYRLGMISREMTLVDSAIQIVDGYLHTLGDPQAAAEWISRHDRLVSRRATLDH